MSLNVPTLKFPSLELSGLVETLHKPMSMSSTHLVSGHKVILWTNWNTNYVHGHQCLLGSCGWTNPHSYTLQNGKPSHFYIDYIWQMTLIRAVYIYLICILCSYITRGPTSGSLAVLGFELTTFHQ